MASHMIEVERTPNPNALRILPGIRLWDRGPPIEVRAGDRTDDVPLAAALLGIEGVASVMVGADFVTIVRGFDREWSEIRPAALGVVGDFALSGRAAVTRTEADRLDEDSLSVDDLIVDQIREVLERFVRPLLARDGGDATLIGFDPASGIARVRMGGACGGCPSGLSTLKGGIEKTIMQYVPEVRQVLATSGSTADEDPRARFRAWVKHKWGMLPGTTGRG